MGLQWAVSRVSARGGTRGQKGKDKDSLEGGREGGNERGVGVFQLLGLNATQKFIFMTRKNELSLRREQKKV